jgi:hypothetical protein
MKPAGCGDLIWYTDGLKVGQLVKLEILRNQKRMTVSFCAPPKCSTWAK